MATMTAMALKKAKGVMKDITSFVKKISIAAPAVALTAAVVPDIMDFMKSVVEPFEQTGEAMGELGDIVSEGFEEMADDIAESIYSLEPVAEEMGIWFQGLYTSIKEKDWLALEKGITEGLDKVWDGIVDFFSDTEKMEDFGKFGASIVMGISNHLNNMTDEEWFAVFHGIEVMMRTFFTLLDYDEIFRGLENAFNNLGANLVLALYEGFTGDELSEAEQEVGRMLIRLISENI